MVGGRALVYCTSWDSVSTPRHLSGRGVGWILMARRLSCVFRALLILLRRSLVFLGFYSSVGVLALNNLLCVLTMYYNTFLNCREPKCGNGSTLRLF